MNKVKLIRPLFVVTGLFLLNISVFASEGAKITMEVQRSDSSILKSVFMQKDNKTRLEESFPNSEEVGNVIISDGMECWHITAIGKPQKYPPIKNSLELIGIDREVIKKEPKGKVMEKLQKTGNKKEMIRYKDFIETEDFGWLPKTIDFYDSDGKLQSRTIIKDVDDDVELSDDLFNYRKVKFSAKAKEIANKMHLE